MKNGSFEADEQSGVARLRVELPEVDIFEFEKPKSKKFKEVVDLPMKMAGGGIQAFGNGRGAFRTVV